MYHTYRVPECTSINAVNAYIGNYMPIKTAEQICEILGAPENFSAESLLKSFKFGRLSEEQDAVLENMLNNKKILKRIVDTYIKANKRNQSVEDVLSGVQSMDNVQYAFFLSILFGTYKFKQAQQTDKISFILTTSYNPEDYSLFLEYQSKNNTAKELMNNQLQALAKILAEKAK